MKLKDLKDLVNGLSDDELDGDLLYKSDDNFISGVVNKMERAKCHYYYTGEDDPSELYTMSQLKDQGYDKEDIDSFEIEIPKGSYFISF